MPNFNHIEQQNLYKTAPYQHINSLVHIENGGATTRHYRVIGAAKFPGDNHIYFDIFGLDGRRITPVYLNWNWENSTSTPAPAVGDKPTSEPSGNIGMIWGVHIWLEIKDFPSERATIPPPDNSSWYICFQLVDSTTPPPPPPPPPPPGEEKPPATPVNFAVQSFTDKSVTLAWSVSDQLAEGFKVFWSKDLATWQSLTTQTMTATVSSLLPDTLYTFRVKAVNQFGESAPAEIQKRTAKTPEPPPDPPPTGELPRVIASSHNRFSPGDSLVLRPTAEVLTPNYIHTATDSYQLISFSLKELKMLVEYMESRGDEFIDLGIELITRAEYERGNS